MLFGIEKKKEEENTVASALSAKRVLLTRILIFVPSAFCGATVFPQW